MESDQSEDFGLEVSSDALKIHFLIQLHSQMLVLHCDMETAFFLLRKILSQKFLQKFGNYALLELSKNLPCNIVTFKN